MCAKLYRVGSGPVNAAEREMVNLLVEGLPDGYGVIPNVVLAEKGRHPYEYDAIVVAPHAIYVVEIKGWHGTVSQVNRTWWRLDSGREVKNPLDVTGHKARVLAGILKDGLSLTDRNGKYLRSPYVLACLLSASDDTLFNVDEEVMRHCFTPSTINTFLQNPFELPIKTPPRNVYKHCWDKIGRFIQGQLEERDVTGRKYGSYVVEEVVEHHEEGGVFEARHSQFDDNQVYRLRTWYISPYKYDKEQQEEQKGLLRRSADALHRVGNHPNLVDFKDVGMQGDEFYEVTTWSDRGTLSSVISLGKNMQMSVERRLKILLGIVRGLDATQEQGVFHRNLTPDAILLGADGQPKIGDFDRALLTNTDQTVYGVLYTGGQNEYLAPELRHQDEYDSFANTDLYSVGIIAFELFTSYLPSMNPKALEQSAEGMPEDVRNDLIAFIDRLRAPNVEDRPGTPAEAAEALERMLATLRGEEGEEAQDDEEAEEADAGSVEELAADGGEAQQDEPAEESEVEEIAETEEVDEEAARQLMGILEPGDIIDESNLVIEQIGNGAYSRVYLVENDVLQGGFAMKVADPEQTDDIQSPRREFTLLRNIGHPHIVRVEWTGRVRPEEGAPAYLLMERLEGIMLDEMIAEGVADKDQAVEWTEQLLDALAHIHPSKEETRTPRLLHRDIKPANILITDGGAVLLDFSSAARADEAGEAPVGTLRYSPPDLADGGWDASCDLFAVGCVFYETLTGKSPWGERAPSLEEAPTPVREHLPKLPAKLANLVDKAVAPKRAERFATAEAFARALGDACTRQRTQYNPTPHVSTTISDAKTDIWTGDFVEQLTQAQHPQSMLFQALRSFAYRKAPESEEDIESVFVDAEARAMVFERPLPQVAPSFYDALLVRTPPLAVGADGAEPEEIRIGEDDVLLVLDGLGYFEVAQLTAAVEKHKLGFDEYVWTAGTTNPGEQDEGTRALQAIIKGLPELVDASKANQIRDTLAEARTAHLELPLGRRGDEGLPHLLERRGRLAVDCFEAALDAADGGRVIVTSTWGTIYLGHGLRHDVGAGMGASADRIRALWSAAFPEGRVGRTDQILTSDVYKPYRDATDPERGARRFPVGRLAWPDRPDSPRLARGGMSLPERLLPFLIIAAD